MTSRSEKFYWAFVVFFSTGKWKRIRKLSDYLGVAKKYGNEITVSDQSRYLLYLGCVGKDFSLSLSSSEVICRTKDWGGRRWRSFRTEDFLPDGRIWTASRDRHKIVNSIKPFIRRFQHLIKFKVSCLLILQKFLITWTWLYNFFEIYQAVGVCFIH